MKPRGVILYDGPSALDGRPVLAILTGLARPSANRKTGAMLQLWILRRDADPVQASAKGKDASVCGACPMRWKTGGSCYVNLGQAPLAVWNAWRRGSYLPATAAELPALVKGRAVRLGAYGDPAALPVAVLEALAAAAGRWTGYTHQWARPAARALQGLCMASCETEAQALAATAQGWRVFLTRPKGSAGELPAGFISCPASAEAGNRTTCERCGLCNGSRGATDTRRSIAIELH